jgi:hypothetical protein
VKEENLLQIRPTASTPQKTLIKETGEEDSPRDTGNQEAVARTLFILDSETNNTRTESTASSTPTPNATVKISKDRIDDFHLPSKAEELEENENVNVNRERKKVYDREGQQEVKIMVQDWGNDKEERENEKVMTTIIHSESAPQTNPQCQTSDTIVDTRRIATRNKKPPGIRVNDDFLWYKTAQPL